MRWLRLALFIKSKFMPRPFSEISRQLIGFGSINELNVEQFDDLLAEIVSTPHPSFITPLLLSLDDTCEFNEVMFGVIHVLERLPRSAYFHEIQQNLDTIYRIAPLWCETLHTRIINSPEAYQEFLKGFNNSGQTIKALEITILKNIANKPPFKSRCEAGIQVLNEMPYAG